MIFNNGKETDVLLSTVNIETENLELGTDYSATIYHAVIN